MPVETTLTDICRRRQRRRVRLGFARLQELHPAAGKSALAGMLTDLARVKEVRIIEEAGTK
jgi:hypothetical protein